MQCTTHWKDFEQIVLAMLACASFFTGSAKRLVSELVPDSIDFLCLLA